MIVSRLLNNLAGSHDASWKRRRGAKGGGGPKREKVSQAPFGMALPPIPPILRAKWQFMLQLRMPTLHDVEVKKSTAVASTFVVRTQTRLAGIVGSKLPDSSRLILHIKGAAEQQKKHRVSFSLFSSFAKVATICSGPPSFLLPFGIAPLDAKHSESALEREAKI